jgi:hypothetical protein
MSSLLSRLHVGSLIITIVLTLGAAIPVDANDSGSSAFQVSGVALRMTPDQAIAAVKQFDPAYVIKKLYMVESLTSFNQTGLENPRGFEDKAYFNSIRAVNEGSDAHSGQQPCRMLPEGMTCSPSPATEDHDEVTIWFSPILHQERVIAIVRRTEFHKIPPTIASLRQSILSKYPGGLTCDTPNTYEGSIFAMLFDRHNRIMSPSAARSKHLLDFRGGCYILPGTGLPYSVSEGGPVGLAVVTQRGDNKELARGFTLSLFDETALFRSIAQSRDYEKKVTQERTAKEVDKAETNGSRTKF